MEARRSTGSGGPTGINCSPSYRAKRQAVVHTTYVGERWTSAGAIQWGGLFAALGGDARATAPRRGVAHLGNEHPCVCVCVCVCVCMCHSVIPPMTSQRNKYFISATQAFIQKAAPPSYVRNDYLFVMDFTLPLQLLVTSSLVETTQGLPPKTNQSRRSRPLYPQQSVPPLLHKPILLGHS